MRCLKDLNKELKTTTTTTTTKLKNEPYYV